MSSNMSSLSYVARSPLQFPAYTTLTRLPLASIGMISDVQYTHTTSIGTNYAQTEYRYYQHAAKALTRAIQAFQVNAQEWNMIQTTRHVVKQQQQQQLQLVKNAHDDSSSASVVEEAASSPMIILHYGDLIDGLNAIKSFSDSIQALEDIWKLLPPPFTQSDAIKQTQKTVEEKDIAITSDFKSSLQRRLDEVQDNAYHNLLTHFLQQQIEQLSASDAAPAASVSSSSLLRMCYLLGNHDLANFGREFWSGLCQFDKLTHSHFHDQITVAVTAQQQQQQQHQHHAHTIPFQTAFPFVQCVHANKTLKAKLAHADSHTNHSSSTSSHTRHEHESLQPDQPSHILPTIASVDHTHNHHNTHHSASTLSSSASTSADMTPSTDDICCPIQPSYYSFCPHPAYRFICLDAYDVSILGYDDSRLYDAAKTHRTADSDRSSETAKASTPKAQRDQQQQPDNDRSHLIHTEPRKHSHVKKQHRHPHVVQAIEYLNEKNPNENKLSPTGLVNENRRYVAFNGGIGAQQLSWLVKELKQSMQLKQRVILNCHVPFTNLCADHVATLWNYDELLSIIGLYPCIVACFYGHDHDGGHGVDEHGVYHHTLEAILTAPEGRDCYGRLDLYEDEMILHGVDLMTSIKMPLPKRFFDAFAK